MDSLINGVGTTRWPSGFLKKVKMGFYSVP